MGQPRPLFVYFFRSFQQQFYRKNCRFQRESNSDRRSRRRARWQLNHHHGPDQILIKCIFNRYLLPCFIWHFVWQADSGRFRRKKWTNSKLRQICIKMAKNDIFVIKIHSSYEESRIEANCWTKKENNFFYIKVGCFDQNISRNLQNRLENMESLKML